MTVISFFWKQSDHFSAIKVLMITMTILEENGDLIKDKENISDILNDFYINIVEKTTGKKPLILNSASTVSADKEIDIINRKYDNHPSIRKIKEIVSQYSQFSLSYATEDTILRILLSLDISKGAGYDTTKNYQISCTNHCHSTNKDCQLVNICQ